MVVGLRRVCWLLGFDELGNLARKVATGDNRFSN
jgi:hypothetical protein